MSSPKDIEGRGPTDPWAGFNDAGAASTDDYLPPLVLPAPSVRADIAEGRDDSPRLRVALRHEFDVGFVPELSLFPGGASARARDVPEPWPSASPPPPNIDLTLDAPTPLAIDAVSVRPSRAPAPRATLQQRIPTGSFRSLVQGVPRRRRAVPVPAPTRGAEPAPAKSRSMFQFAVSAALLGLLNVPLLLVATNGLNAWTGSDDALSVAEVVALEERIAASPAEGEALLAAEGLDRESWVELLGTIATDPEVASDLRAERESRSN